MMKMPKINYCRCDGGKKGEKCKNILQKACDNFFSIGINNIENACNVERARLIKEWEEKNSNEQIKEFNFNISYKQGIEELSPIFRLYEPIEINVYIDEGEKPKNRVPMGVRPIDKELKKWDFFVFLDNLDYSDDTLKWTGFEESVDDLVYHELFHTCGDNKDTGKIDGILRYNIVGIKCIKELTG